MIECNVLNHDFLEPGIDVGLDIACLRLPDGSKGIFVQKVHPDSTAAQAESIR